MLLRKPKKDAPVGCSELEHGVDIREGLAFVELLLNHERSADEGALRGVHASLRIRIGTTAREPRSSNRALHLTWRRASCACALALLRQRPKWEVTISKTCRCRRRNRGLLAGKWQRKVEERTTQTNAWQLAPGHVIIEPTLVV